MENHRQQLEQERQPEDYEIDLTWVYKLSAWLFAGWLLANAIILLSGCNAQPVVLESDRSVEIKIEQRLTGESI